MRLRQKQNLPDCQINIAPLIDVVFLLIIFFMVVSQFSSLEVEALVLPRATQSKTLTSNAPMSKLIVNVHQDGRMIVSGTQYELDGLDSLLQKTLKQNPKQKLSILIRSDRLTHWQRVREIMNLCAKQGISRVKVAVLNPTAKQ